MGKLTKARFTVIMIALALGLTLVSVIVIVCINLADAKKQDQSKQTQNNKSSYVMSDIAYDIASDSNGDVWIQCFAKVTNTGSNNLYLPTGKFDLTDEESKTVDSFLANPYPQVIAPGETAIYFESKKMEYQSLSAKYKQYNINLSFDAMESTVPLIRYEVSKLNFSSSVLGVLEVKGDVTNSSPYSSYDCVIFVKFYDKEGNFLGIYDTYLTEEISPGETESFEILALNYCFGVTPDNIGTCVAISYPYQYRYE